MSNVNQPQDSLQDVRDIKRFMEKSSRFTSLSGLSCISAGVCALVGAGYAYWMLNERFGSYLPGEDRMSASLTAIKYQLLIVAAIVFAAAAITGFYFTWRKARQQGVSLTDYTSRMVFWNMAVFLGTGGLFVLGMIQLDEWRFVAPACLVFYGLALINSGKHTVTDIRYLGYCEVILGLVNIFWLGYQFGYGLYFWAIGFGVLHIIYGIIMWWKYERQGN